MGDWFALLTEDESDYAGWLLKLAKDLQYPPWLLSPTITQIYGFWHREQAGEMSYAKQIEIVNRARKRKGLPPLDDGLPKAVRENMKTKPKDG